MISKEVLKFYHQRYKFIGLNLDDFSSLVLSFCPENISDDEVKTYVENCVLEYTNSLFLTDEITVYKLFKKAVTCLKVEYLFNFLEKLSEAYHIDINDNDIEKMSTFAELQDVYDDISKSIDDEDLLDENKACLLYSVIILYKINKANKLAEQDYGSRDFDSFYAISNEIKDKHILTPDEELELFTKLKNGIDVKKQIAEGNLRLVLKVANYYKKKNSNIPLKLEDLFQEGCIGLYKAIENFDIEKGNKFSTYAVKRILAPMRIFARKSSRNMPVSSHVIKRISDLIKIMNDLRVEGIEEPSNKLLAEKSGLDESTVANLITIMHDTVSLDEENEGDDGDRDSLKEFITSNDKIYNVEETAYDIVKSNDLYNALSVFDERTRNAVILNYGLFGNRPHSLPEIGKIYNVTHEAIRQDIADAIDILKILLRKYASDYEAEPMYENIKIILNRGVDENVNIHLRFEKFASFLRKIKEKGINVSITEFYPYEYLVKVKCNCCGEEQIMRPLELTSLNYKCPKCSIIKKMEKYQKEIDKLNPNIRIIEFEKIRIPARFRCSCCGAEWIASINSILLTPKCVSCNGFDKSPRTKKE